MSQYISNAGGYLLNPAGSANCQFCSRNSTDVFLSGFNMSFDNRWRDLGLMFAYTIFNVFLIFACTYVFRIRRWRR
ncbi:hypothetical protein BDV93DRAFT_612111 [Ceratobasidium sp. AG-I]|nr:hypothetical protein BDV93DRAFT_612111 [Ceratobasidium sp. AG-I]